MPAPALAGSGDAPLPELSQKLRYEVAGEVAVSCGLTNDAPAGAVKFENAVDPSHNVGRADKASLPFTVACNTPVLIKMTSDQGGLGNSGAGTSDQDFTNILAYSAQLNLPGRTNALLCTSANMRADANACSGTINDAVTEGHGAVDVTLTPDGRQLLQGTYADRVTITVTPVLVSSGT